jgi:uncharacterized protein DUF1552
MSPSSRRRFLQGLGTMLALPWMESLLPAADRPQLCAKGWPGLDGPRAVNRKRLIYLYVPNGIHMPAWTPQQTGHKFDLPFLLEPLRPFRSHFSVLSGLTQDLARAHGDGPGDHARAAAVFLTGVHPLKTDGQIRLAASADQLAAQQVGGTTAFHSLQLGVERGGNAGQCDSGYSCAYSSNISWQNQTTPAGKEVNPRLVFERLFRGGKSTADSQARTERAARRRSILDYVAVQAKEMRRTLSKDDRIKLDEYLSGIREVERRIQFAEQDYVAAVPDSARPQATLPDYGQHVRLMMDLLVLALQTDRTRIATFMLANEGSNRSYPMLDIREGHHEISHHKNKPAKQRQIRTINRFHTEQLAYLLKRLQQTQEGQGSLLDSIMMVYGSGIGDGNRHNHDHLPILLIGGGDGSLTPGQHLSFAEQTPLNNLHVSLLERMGVAQPQLGDSSGSLPGL